MLPALKYVFAALLLYNGCLYAQKETPTAKPPGNLAADTTEADSLLRPTKRHPGRAALMSAIVPGLGQVYNHKYWKLPIVYAGLGTAIYFIDLNRDVYLELKRAYVQDTNVADNDVSRYYERGYTTEQIRNAADQRRKWMEYSYIALAAVYALQIVDAAVDAHLFYFDVSDDLTMNVTPTLQYASNREPVHGLTLRFTF